ncbi:serine/threonine-protein kinase [Nocardia sp. NPDC050406]|uniref:serine/threonine-protein kinase n=1 Tax=Nocardia sp. NPDC050406 TaxID=3364318 RepID=UPI0037A0F18D
MAVRELASGSVIAGYRIERQLGIGGMGAVYLARHPRLPRHDALKVIAGARGAEPRFRERFRREAELASRLDHPNVVAIHDSGEDGETLWIAMQFVDGHNCAELLRTAALPAERAIAITAQAARGLDAAHAAGLLHRDVKPANILISRDGERVLVTDFGLAEETGAAAPTGTTSATLAYAAPEQFLDGPLDHRADVYGLGATLYHLLTGQVPYPRDTQAAMLHAQVSAAPPRPSRVVPALPVALDAVIARALAKDPAQRYDSCGELAEAARATLGGRSFRRTRGIRRAAVACAAAATVAATVAAVALTDTGPTATADSAVATSTDAVPVSPWGRAAFIAEAFPELLPAAPSTPGYLGLTCDTVDDPRQPAVVCTGDNDTLWWLLVKCRTDRTPNPPITDESAVTWTRASGSGTALSRTDPDQYRSQVGKLEIRFDTPNRNFCELQAYGMSTGPELYEQWWPTAPI